VITFIIPAATTDIRREELATTQHGDMKRGVVPSCIPLFLRTQRKVLT